MIAKLDNVNEAVAKQIYTTFQHSYKIEAEERISAIQICKQYACHAMVNRLH